MTNRGDETPSIRKDVENLCEIITRLSVKSLADAGSDVCETYFFAIADASEQRDALICELDFRESTVMANNEKPKLFLVRDHYNEGE